MQLLYAFLLFCEDGTARRLARPVTGRGAHFLPRIFCSILYSLILQLITDELFSRGNPSFSLLPFYLFICLTHFLVRLQLH